MKKNSSVVLLILDGWGYNTNKNYNAIASAHTPQWDEWWDSCPHILLNASGTSVGLPGEQMGNSEVGHMHIGAGRIIEQDFTRINQAIKDGSFSSNTLFNTTLEHLKKTQRSLHIMGLLSPGGVHSHEQHLFAFLELCYQKQFYQVCLHLFLDGRDTPPKSALQSLEKLNSVLENHSVGRIVSICGRYYAMDRDQRWNRVEPVYQLLTEGRSDTHFNDAKEAIEFFYQKECSDEFIPPTSIGEKHPIVDGDAVFFFNFRSDRARQLSAAFVDPLFKGFKRNTIPKLHHFVTLTQYDKNLNTAVAFPPMSLNNTLGECVAMKGLSQLRIAETEKYAHVTFFFNGGNEQPFPQEHRILIPSPQIATYDLQPEMSAPELTVALVDAINSSVYDIIICNYANADMVGHTGNLKATIQAIECLDRCITEVGKAVIAQGGKLLITADHGNAEAMFDEATHQAHTAHTSEPVPLLFVGGGWHFIHSTGSLIDIAPTVLTLLDLPPPTDMTGHSLLEKNHVST